MPKLHEGNLTLTFSDDWEISKYDDWRFYRNRFENCCLGNKAVDFVAFSPAERVLWLIELKDFRRNSRTKRIALWDEVAIKVRDTLSGLFAARVDCNHPEQALARRAATATKLRVVLHLEQTVKPSVLFPRPFQSADVQQKLKQLVKPIDAHPLVVELAAMGGVPWTAHWKSSTE